MNKKNSVKNIFRGKPLSNNIFHWHWLIFWNAVASNEFRFYNRKISVFTRVWEPKSFLCVSDRKNIVRKQFILSLSLSRAFDPDPKAKSKFLKTIHKHKCWQQVNELTVWYWCMNNNQCKLPAPERMNERKRSKFNSKPNITLQTTTASFIPPKYF